MDRRQDGLGAKVDGPVDLAPAGPRIVMAEFGDIGTGEEAASPAQDDGRLDPRIRLDLPNPGVKPGADGSADQIQRRIVAEQEGEMPAALQGHGPGELDRRVPALRIWPGSLVGLAISGQPKPRSVWPVGNPESLRSRSCGGQYPLSAPIHTASYDRDRRSAGPVHPDTGCKLLCRGWGSLIIYVVGSNCVSL